MNIQLSDETIQALQAAGQKFSTAQWLIGELTETLINAYEHNTVYEVYDIVARYCNRSSESVKRCRETFRFYYKDSIRAEYLAELRNYPFTFEHFCQAMSLYNGSFILNPMTALSWCLDNMQSNLPSAMQMRLHFIEDKEVKRLTKLTPPQKKFESLRRELNGWIQDIRDIDKADSLSNWIKQGEKLLYD